MKLDKKLSILLVLMFQTTTFARRPASFRIGKKDKNLKEVALEFSTPGWEKKTARPRGKFYFIVSLISVTEPTSFSKIKPPEYLEVLEKDPPSP